MKKIQVKIITLICLLWTSFIYAQNLVKIEAKAFDGNTFFVFYHKKEQKINIDSAGRNIIVDLTEASDHQIINPSFFYNFASSVTQSKDKRYLNFSTKDEFNSKIIINGEKLTAIKFRNEAEDDNKQKPIIKIDEDAYKSFDHEIIKYSTSKNEAELSFALDSSNVQMAAFFRGKYLWVIFDAPKKFTFIENKTFSKFMQINSDGGTALRFRVDGYSKAKAVKKDKNWHLVFTDKIKNSTSSLKLQEIAGEEGIKIEGDFSNNLLIEFKDPEVGDTIKVIPVNDPMMRIFQTKDSVDFTLLPSIIGLVATIKSDDINIIKEKNYLKISAKHILPEVGVQDQPQEFSGQLINYQKEKGSLIPILDKKLDILSFNNNRARLLNEIANAENNTDNFTKRFELAKFYFINGLYNEAFAMLKLAQKFCVKEYSENLQARFTTAVAATLIGSVDQAREIYKELLKNFDLSKFGEITLWNNYNEFLIGNSNNKLGFLQNSSSSINQYPDNIYWPLALAEIDLNLVLNDLRTIETIFKELKIPKDEKYADSLKYYKANYYRKKNQANLAKQFFTDLIGKDSDPFNKVRAEMDLVKLQLAENEIDINTAIKRLNEIKLLWRGDKLEYDLLMQQANYYSAVGDAMNTLRSYKYIQSSFSNRVNNFYLKSEMVKIFNKVFLKEDNNLNSLDDFSAVALFYEFKDLNPIGEEGDEVILSIARKLTNLDLLENAVDLLDHQVKYRLSGAKRVINADHLAVILLMDGKPKQALNILNDTDKENFKFGEHQYRLRLKAKALIDLQNYVDALSYVKDDDSIDAMIIRKEAYFRSERWKEYIEVAARAVDNIKGPIENEVAQDFLRLAIAYYMDNRQNELQDLSKILEKNPNQQIKNIVDLLLTGNGIIDYKNLDKSLNVNQLQTLLNKLKLQIFQAK